MEAYFAERASLAGLLIIVDARRGFGESDEAMLDYAHARGHSRRTCCSSKSDKLGRNERRRRCRRRGQTLGGRATVQLFSAESGEGVERRRARSTRCWRGT